MAAHDWTIRSAGAADATEALALWAAAGIAPGVGDTPEGIAALLGSDPDALLLAESRRRLVGSLIAVWDGWRGSFYRLAVQPERRREGIATGLLREGERRLRDRGALRLTAIVAEDEPLALEFWRAAGYERQPNRVRFLRHLDL
ncbi:MAG TPA: GNAT family N-acetyltransferase [Solirubrobacteraceae bacterium]